MINVGIIGATGYVGEELVRLLTSHPDVNIALLVSKSFSGKSMSDVYTNFYALSNLVLEDTDINAIKKKCQFVFLCLPHGESIKIAPQLLAENIKVIDLSGDFRYKDATVYEEWYGIKHTSPEILKNSVYGLSEFFKHEVANTNMLANPGCYTTTSILALAPLLKEGLISTKGIVIDAKSGVSGAGRQEKLNYSFCETQGNFSAYSVVNHRHTSEIEEQLTTISGKAVNLLFTPHLLPIKRGILATIYADIKEGVSEKDIYSAYENAYKDALFVQIMAFKSLPQLKYVVGSNNCQIGFDISKRTGKIVIVACLDNLIKGAAGSAIQNFNIMNNIEETTGLPQVAWYL